MMDGRRSTHRKRSPWAAWYGEDYRDGVAELSDAACGVYSKLISYQISHGSFPHPDTHFEQACKVALTTPESLQNVWPEISCKFRKRPDGRLENARMAEEIRVRNGIREARIDAAAKSHANRSAKPRANVSAKAPVLHDAKDPCLHDASPSPSPFSSKEESIHPPAKASGAAARPVLAGKGKCSLEEAIAYAQERGFPPSDGAAFHDALEANGWRTRVGPLKDWKAAFRTKEINGWLASQQKNGVGAPPKGSKNAGTMNEGMSSQYRRQTP